MTTMVFSSLCQRGRLIASPLLLPVSTCMLNGITKRAAFEEDYRVICPGISGAKLPCF